MTDNITRAKTAARNLFADKTSRRAILAGAGVATIGAAAAILLTPKGELSVGGNLIDIDELKPLGDGFYLADGWVLSEADLHKAGVALPHTKD